MAAVTRPVFSYPAPPAGGGRRRWWLIAIVAGWIVVLGGLAFWSVGSSPPTVSEQRDIAQAVPELRKATGVVLAAAGGPGRAVVLGELALAEGCRVTAVRDGAEASREIVVHVREGEARAALEAIAAAGYPADVADSRGGTRLSLHADAGNFIGIDADTEAAARAVTVRITTGCRPKAAETSADPSAGPPPEALNEILVRLGAGDEAKPVETETVACPDGGVAGTYRVDDIAEPSDVARRLPETGGAVRGGPDVWAYRTGNDSVVVTREESRLRVEVGTGC